MNEEIKNECKCDEHKECTCGDECNCTPEENCGCMKNCGCEDDCTCDKECTCGDGCDCENELKEKKRRTMKYKDKNSKKLQEANDKIKQLEEKLIRQNADMINYRKRKEEEVSRMLKFCNEDIVKALLPTIDNFERAIKMDDDNLEDEVSKFLEGFKMVYCNFNQVLADFDVKTIDEVNVEFDPNYHNAIMVDHKEGVEPGMILEVLQKGYILKDKVIRPAMVKVSE